MDVGGGNEDEMDGVGGRQRRLPRRAAGRKAWKNIVHAALDLRSFAHVHICLGAYERTDRVRRRPARHRRGADPAADRQLSRRRSAVRVRSCRPCSTCRSPRCRATSRCCAAPISWRIRRSRQFVLYRLRRSPDTPGTLIVGRARRARAGRAFAGRAAAGGGAQPLAHPGAGLARRPTSLVADREPR